MSSTDLKKPTSQTLEVLYLLIKYNYLTRADFINQASVLNAPARVHNLRKLGCDIEIQMITTTNKFGREVKYGIYYLNDKSKAIELYNKLSK